ncbi:hypothetical protein [Xylella fastidiosa]|nr:hypothetical protein [Xylella fastidiosa]MDG5822006.1 hypothetical protein [Xylella fastidiosa subsp. pauca]MDG5825599.1 hypothetical protein [Xylella fastidiosa subsp. pauca]WGZ33666.1 hypothetical protein O4445_08315 [Xylella fastidiosa subsp. pauca]WGZ35990.1 hypothetical protein O4443_08295 [Xylella fastidiosa subsp. pauca]
MRELSKVEIEQVSGASTSTTIWDDVVAATNGIWSGLVTATSNIFGGAVTATNNILGGTAAGTNNIFNQFINSYFFRNYISISSLFSNDSTVVDKKS